MGIERLIEELASVIGDRWVFTKKWELYPYTRDYWPLMVYQEITENLNNEPIAVIQPGSEEEVLSVMRIINKYRIPVVIYSGGSGVLGGAVPRSDWIVIDLSRLDWIKWYDKAAGIVDVGAGVYLRRLEEWLNNQGRSLRHFPQSYPEAMIGGLVATRSIGQYSTGYGGIEDIVLGLHVITPSNGVLKIKPVPRRSTLIPLREMFIGSEGLYGIITRVYLSTYSLPNCIEKIGWLNDSFEKSLNLAKELMSLRVAPDLYRVYDTNESLVHFDSNRSVSIGVIEGSCEVVEAKRKVIEKLVGRDVYECSSCTDKWLRDRFNVIKDIYRLYKAGMGFDTIEIGITWGNVLDFYNETIKKLESVNNIVFVGVHASHFYQSGAALYYTIVFDLQKYRETYNLMWDIMMETTVKYGGTISHHHGIGLQRIKYLESEIGMEGLYILKGLKKLLDPSEVLRNRTL